MARESHATADVPGKVTRVSWKLHVRRNWQRQDLGEAEGEGGHPGAGTELGLAEG